MKTGSKDAVFSRLFSCPRLAAKEPYLRINVTLQQFDEFPETCGIQEGGGMYLSGEDRILIR